MPDRHILFKLLPAIVGQKIANADDIELDSTGLTGAINGSGDVQESLDRIDATGLGADIISFTGSFTARDSNLNDWFRTRQSVILEHTAGGTNAIRTFTLPDLDALNAAFDALEARNVGQVLTLTIGYQGGSTTSITRNALRIQAPSVSALFNTNEIPTIIPQGSAVTFRIERSGGSISTWERIGTMQSPSSNEVFNDLQFQQQGWSNAAGSFLPSNPQFGYAYRVFGSNPNNGALRTGLLPGDTRTIYDGDYVVFIGNSFTSWTVASDWFVLPIETLQRFSIAGTNFLQNVVETDFREDVGDINTLGAEGLMWISPVIMQRAPYLTPNDDNGGAPDGNPRPNAGGERYIGGRTNRNGTKFQFGANFFNGYLYIGASPNFITAHGEENLDIIVRDDSGDEVTRFNLDTQFLQVDDDTFSNSTLNHYIYNAGSGSGTTFSYASLMTIEIVLTRENQTFTFSPSVNPTSRVNNLQESQLSGELQTLLDRLKDVNPDQPTDFSSILDRISPYRTLRIGEIYRDVYYDGTNTTQSFPTDLSTLTQVHPDDPKFSVGTTSVFIYVEGGRDYILANNTTSSMTPLDHSSPNVDLGISISVGGKTYFGYRVSGLTANDEFQIFTSRTEQVVAWQNDIDTLKANIDTINAELSHAALNLPDEVVHVLENETSVTEQSNPTIVATDFNKSFSTNDTQTISYETNPNTPTSGHLNSKPISESANKLIFVNNQHVYGNSIFVHAFDGTTSTDLVDYSQNQFIAKQFVPAVPSGSQTVTIYPAPSNRVSGSGVWQTIEALTFTNGMPVPLADELFFTRNVPADSVPISIQYRGHANGNLFGSGTTTLPANQTSISFILDDGGEQATVEVRRYASGEIRIAVTERVNAGLPTINDVQVILSYSETRTIPAVAETTIDVLISDNVNSGHEFVLGFRTSTTNTLIIVGNLGEVDTGYLLTDLFAVGLTGHLTVFSEQAEFLNYVNTNPTEPVVVQLENHASLPKYGLFTTEYDHETILAFDTAVEANGVVVYGSLTTVQRDALPTTKPAIIYNSTTNRFEFLENNTWTGKVNLGS